MLPNHLYKQALDNALDVIFITEANFDDVGGSPIVYVNQAFTKLTGYDPEEIIGQSPRILQGDNTSTETLRKIRSAMQKKQSIRTEILNYVKSGKEYWLDINIVPLTNEQGDVTHFLSIERDLSKRIELEKRLYHDATVDSLTQLSNRQHFFELCSNELSISKRYSKICCLLMIDIDHFKHINDEFGHQVGDKALAKTGQVLLSQSRSSDILGRIGGEEFAMLLPQSSISDSLHVGERIRSAMEAADWASENIPYPITVSIGLAKFQFDEAIESLHKRADDALYQAKASGRNCIVNANRHDEFE